MRILDLFSFSGTHSVANATRPLSRSATSEVIGMNSYSALFVVREAAQSLWVLILSERQSLKAVSG
jgi:hypothetical protein